MKCLLNVIINFGIIFLISSSCQKSEVPDCIRGKVIGYQSCININIIQVESGSLNGTTTLWNGKNYEDVVQSPGGKILDSLIYFNYRSFDSSKDTLINNAVCPANISPLTVPIIIITRYSSINCPNSD